MAHRNLRILVVTDQADPSGALLEEMRRRARAGDVQFRVVVPNPARAEVHLLHPERHEKAREAEVVLRRALPLLEHAAGGAVIGSVSVRHDPVDAVEEILFGEPVDEIMVAVAPHGLAAHLPVDLARRWHHWGMPVTVVSRERVRH